MQIIMEEYLVNPFIGVNEFKFGMSESAVVQLLGSVNFIKRNEGNVIKLNIEPVSFTFEQDRLCEMSFLNTANLFVEGLTVFGNFFLENISAKYNRKLKFGFDIFDDVGLALSGFSAPEERKTATVYKRGYWDELLKM